MRRRRLTASVLSTFIGAAVVACSAPGGTPTTPPAQPPASTAAVASASVAPATTVTAASATGQLIQGEGFTLRAPAEHVDVTERAQSAMARMPLFGGSDQQILGVFVHSSDPGNLSHALVVSVLADKLDPVSAARDLAARSGGTGDVVPVAVGGDTWYRFGVTLNSVAGTGLLTRFNGRNIVLAEAGADPVSADVWKVAASLTRA